MRRLLPIAFLLLSSCHPLGEHVIRGELKVSPQWGQSISLYDTKSGKNVNLTNGTYELSFPFRYWFTEPKVEIRNAKGELMVTMKIPITRVQPDETFDFLSIADGQAQGFHILGGQRKLILSRQRYAAIRQHCTYTTTETYSGTCSDGKKSYSCLKTRTVTHSGNQDAVKEKRQVRALYRLLFDGYDMMNAADFSGQTKDYEEIIELAATSCS